MPPLPDQQSGPTGDRPRTGLDVAAATPVSLVRQKNSAAASLSPPPPNLRRVTVDSLTAYDYAVSTDCRLAWFLFNQSSFAELL